MQQVGESPGAPGKSKLDSAWIDSAKEPPKLIGFKAWEMLNSALFLWIMSTVVVSLGTWAYTQWDQKQTLKKKTDESHHNIVREVQSRVHVFKTIAWQFGTDAAVRASSEARYKDLRSQAKLLQERIERAAEVEHLQADELKEEDNLETTMKERRAVYEELLQNNEIGNLTVAAGQNENDDKKRLALARTLADTARHPDPIAESLLHFLSTADLTRELLSKDEIPDSVETWLSNQEAAEKSIATALVGELSFANDWMYVASKGAFGGYLKYQFMDFNGGLEYQETSKWILKQLTPRADAGRSQSIVDFYYQDALRQTMQGGGKSLLGVVGSEVPYMLLSALYVTLNREILPAIFRLDTSLRQQSSQTRLWRESLLDQKSHTDTSLKSVSDRLSQATISYDELERQFEEPIAGANVFPEFKAVALSGLIAQLESLGNKNSRERITRFSAVHRQLSDELRNFRPSSFNALQFQAQILPLVDRLDGAASRLTM